MFTWAKIPFVRIVLFFITGIWFGLYFPGHHLLIFGVVFCVFASLLLLRSRWPMLFVRMNYLYGLQISILFVGLGYITIWLHNAVNSNKNLTQFDDVQQYVVEVISNPEPRNKSTRLLVEVKEVHFGNGWQEADGRVLLYFRKNEDKRFPGIGNVLLISGTPELVKPPKNPYEFDYRRYLEHRGIYHTQWLGDENWYHLHGPTGFDLFRFANKTRSFLENIFEKSISDTRSLGVIKALVLGNKGELDPEMKLTFATAGVMHVLAVSGLHVGIIYLILILLLKPLTLRSKRPWVVSAFIILILWIYAFITGLPPSVLRAVTMFSIIELGRRMGREASIFNSLAMSAFLLLCIDPFLITSVGFQLSYAAVTGILLLFRPISSLFRPENRILRYFWQLIAVSIAAQIATAPLAAFYFNQFPTYFLVSNIFVIPAVTILVWSGVVLLFVGLISTSMAGLLGQLIIGIITAMENVLLIITDWPFATIQNLAPAYLDVVLINTFIGLLIAIIMIGGRRNLRIGLSVLTIIFAVRTIAQTNQRKKANELVFYSLNESNWAIDLVSNGQYIALSDSSLTESTINYSIKPYRTGEHLEASNKNASMRHIEDLGKIVVWQNKKILIAETCAHDHQQKALFDFIYQPNHPRFMDCYSDRNLLIKLVGDDYVGHSLSEAAYIVDIN